MLDSVISENSETKENQAAMIMSMEKKLNSGSYALFKYANKKDAHLCRISTSQYWDLLTYIDDDYLTDFEVLKMKEMYAW